MLPLLVSVFAPLPDWEEPEAFEPEWLVPADASFTGGANYVIYNTVNGKRYEGETVNFHNRHNDHKNEPFNPNRKKSYNSHLYRSIRKYGFENFKFYFRHTFVFEGFSKLSKYEKIAFYKKFKEATLHPCETYWIKRLDLLDDRKGYNKKESGEGGAGHIPSAETRAKLSVAGMGNTNAPTKCVTSCKIIEDGKTYQKVRLTRYESATVAAKALGNPRLRNTISACCVGKNKSAGGYLWWFCKDTDVYDKDIMIKRVGDLPGTMRNLGHMKAVISVLKLENGHLEQWHNGLKEAADTLSTQSKKIHPSNISKCCSGKHKKQKGYTFRKVTTEKREDFDKYGKRIVKILKRKRI